MTDELYSTAPGAEGSGRPQSRGAGILIHVTSLPGPLGIGDLGPATLRFLDWVAEAGFRAWQVLPVGPTTNHHSPYSALSAFAGNPLLISPRRLADEGWIPRDAVGAAETRPSGPVNFAAIQPWRNRLLRRAWSEQRRLNRPDTRRDLDAFVENEEQRAWLEDWVLYRALKTHHGGVSWTEWDAELRSRQPRALFDASRELSEEMDYERFVQFAFRRQWDALRRAAHLRGIEIIGDAPYYVGLDSADVWAHQELFKLDGLGRPRKVAGVPPDYFSETGQFWGNPVYDWKRMEHDGFAWWIERVRSNLQRFDRLRLDHFRGFAGYWEIDASETTAVHGRWADGPGCRLFESLRQALGPLPLIAEDLGDITPDVIELRDGLRLPGMVVLQFLLGADDPFPPPDLERQDAVVYTGTHDNDTTRGWFNALDERNRRALLQRLGTDDDIVWKVIESACASRARLAVIPAQDLLGADTESRMNLPGVAEGNWTWRAPRQGLSQALAQDVWKLLRETDRTG